MIFEKLNFLGYLRVLATGDHIIAKSQLDTVSCWM